MVEIEVDIQLPVEMEEALGTGDSVGQEGNGAAQTVCKWSGGSSAHPARVN